MGKKNKKSLLTVGEVSKKLGVNSQFLRRLDWRGVVVPQRTASGYRLYSQEDINAIEEIVSLSKAGITQKAAWKGLLHKKKEVPVENLRWLNKIQKKSSSSIELTLSAVETLAVVAYKEPITIAEVEQIRGVDTRYPLQDLLNQGLVRACGTTRLLGRPLVFGVTKKFLNHFEIKELDKMDPKKTIKIIPTPRIKKGIYRLKKEWIKSKKTKPPDVIT
jgi:segregation and condensation protein B